jgi:hypothetical protein
MDTPTGATMTLSRQALIVPEHIQHLKVLMIGAGSIGSMTASMLLRMGVKNLTVYDRDTVSIENIGPSIYGLNDLTKTKTASLHDLLLTATGISITTKNRFYTSQRETADVVIVTVDSMEARRFIWERQQIAGWRMWIDARMGFDQCSTTVCFSDNPKSTEFYSRSIARAGAPLPCGQKATAFISGGIVVGFIGTVLTRWIRGLPVPQELFYKGFVDDAPWFSVMG